MSTRELEQLERKRLLSKLNTLYEQLAEYELQEFEADSISERRKAHRMSEILKKQIERNENRYRNLDVQVEEQKEFHPLYQGADTGRIETLSWSPDGRYLASGSSDGMIRIWEVKASKTPFEREKHRGSVQALAWSPDGVSIASANIHTLIWHWRTGEKVAAFRHGPPAVKALDWSARGKALALARGRYVEIWQGHEHTYKKAWTYASHSSGQRVEAVAWSPDGSALASCNSSQIHIWRPGRKPGTTETTHTHHHEFGRLTTLAWDRSGQRVFLGAHTYASASVKVWEPFEKRDPQAIGAHQGQISALASSPDGELFASGSFDGTVKVWDTQTFKDVLTFDNLAEDPPGHVHALAWSPDSNSLAIAIDYMVYVLPKPARNNR